MRVMLLVCHPDADSHHAAVHRVTRAAPERIGQPVARVAARS